ncbi:MAG: MFS transporter [Anaerolineae bacterium]|nr:MFS transporter [Anaerolineae bacterium]
MLALLRQRNYGLLWWGQLVSMLGNWARFAALPFFVYQLTGSVLASGAMFMVQAVPPVLLGAMAGVFVDRWDRRGTLIGADLLRALILLLLLFVRSPETIWMVYLVGFAQSAVSQFYGPANNALLPHLVREDRLVTANALDSLGENIARVLGPAVGAWMLGWLGLGSVVLLNAGSYLVASLLLGLMRVPPEALRAPRQEGAGPSAGASFRAVWADLAAGLRLMAARPPLARAFLVNGVALLADSMLTVLMVPFFTDIVGLDAVGYGWVLTARGAGGILGGLLVGQIGHRFQTSHLWAAGALAAGGLLLILVHWPLLWAVLVGLIVIGPFLMAWLIASQTWLQSHAPDAYRGRVFGAYGAVTAVMALVGMGAASAMGDGVGIVPTLDVSGLLYIVAGIMALALLSEAALAAATAKRAATSVAPPAGE